MTDKLNADSILVVEDESLVRLMAVEMLEDAGFRVFEAHNGESALRILAEHVDLSALFTDVELANGINGFHLARIFHDTRPEMPIIVVSGQFTAKDGDLPKGSRFIGKPYEPDAVTAALREMIDSAKQDDC